MPVVPADIWAYAKELVENKGVLSRVGHSAALHSARSAVSSPGSFASKSANLVLSAGKGLLKLIPVPGVPALIEVIADKANEVARKYHHGKRLEAAKAAGDEVTRLKFEIKELSMDEMDRFRWKVTAAMEDLNTKIREMQNLSNNTPCCEKYLEIVTACQQAQRRIDRLAEKTRTIKEVMLSIETWLADCQTRLSAGKTNITSALSTYAAAQTAECDKANNNYLPNLKARLQTAQQKLQVETQKAVRDKAAGISPGWFSSLTVSPLESAGIEVAAVQGMISAGEKNHGQGAENFIKTDHAPCASWCVFKSSTPEDNWKSFRSNAADVTKFLVQFATVAIPMEVAADKIHDKITNG
ncbi:MAG: hypothetical protein ACRD0Y_04260 [Terriglobales bacterium]